MGPASVTAAMLFSDMSFKQKPLFRAQLGTYVRAERPLGDRALSRLGDWSPVTVKLLKGHYMQMFL